jgi:hypothetical protein
MNQISEGSQSPTTTSNTKSATESGTQISGSELTADAGRGVSKIDDKAAVLENQLLECKANFNKERFVYIFTIVTLVDVCIGWSAPSSVFATLIVASIIILIGLANWLEFPWVVENLGRWLTMIERRFSGQKQDETEP